MGADLLKSVNAICTINSRLCLSIINITPTSYISLERRKNKPTMLISFLKFKSTKRDSPLNLHYCKLTGGIQNLKTKKVEDMH